MSYRLHPKSAYSVYFAATDLTNMVKIGCSTQPEERLCQIGEWVPFKIRLVAFTPGAHDLETHFHALFDKSWSHLEWFHYTDDIKEVVQQINAGKTFAPVLSGSGTRKQKEMTLKKRLSHRITTAERHAFPELHYQERCALRPDYLKQVILGFTGRHNPAPSKSAHDAVERYIAELERAV